MLFIAFVLNVVAVWFLIQMFRKNARSITSEKNFPVLVWVVISVGVFFVALFQQPTTGTQAPIGNAIGNAFVWGIHLAALLLSILAAVVSFVRSQSMGKRL